MLEAALAISDDPERPFPFTYWEVWTPWRARTEEDDWPWPGLRLHDLRHSFVSNQLEQGTPIHVVRDLAAHASVVTSQLYAHSSDEARRAAVERLVIRPELAQFERRDTDRDTTAAVGPEDGKAKAPETVRSRGLSRLGHPGLEPGANGLRVHCSTN